MNTFLDNITIRRIEEAIWPRLREALKQSPDGLLSLDQVKPAVREGLKDAAERHN
jgi:hypothetical protein